MIRTENVVGNTKNKDNTKKTVVFTIASKNYFAYVRTIMQSLEQSNPHMARCAVVVDDLDDEFVALPRNFDLLELDRLDLPHPEQMKFRYDIMEMNTAVKPFAILKLFEKYDRVIYLDPDIYVYKRLSPVEEAMDAGANIVLTPHFNGLFEDDGMHPDEPDIMRTGTYNLGFIGLNRCDDTIKMVSWWANKLEKQCVSEQEKGIFVDQKWIDLVPGYYEHVSVLHQSGLNVAYWNLSHRTIVKNGEDFEVNGDPLIFYHFSGLNPNNIDVISKYQNRFMLKDIGDGAELFEKYAKVVLSNEFDMWKKFKYSFETYTDGRKVLPAHRALYRQNKQLQGYCGENPFMYADIFYGDKEMEFKTNGVNLVGYISSEHGLGEACRLTANCLEASDINWIAYDFEIGNSSKKGDKSYKAKTEQYIKYDISLININADQFSALHNFAPAELWKTYNIGIWYWELPEFPDKWQRAFMDVDEIWAPTQFIADCLKKCAPCPVYHMPPGIYRPKVDTDIYNRDYYDLPENAFLFLNMFDVYSFSGRKNPEAAVNAFQAAFASDDMSVGLVLKLNNSGYTDEVRQKLEELIGDYKNIYLLAKTMPREAVNGLINTCDVAVSLHRSEGLGLLCEEAMCYGKPVIATGWSGNMDFMNSENSCLVDYSLCEVGENIGPYEAWQTWADPSVAQATEYMKRLVSDKAYYGSIAKNAKATIKEQFSPEICGRKMAMRLAEIYHSEKNMYRNNVQSGSKCLALVCLGVYQELMHRRLGVDEREEVLDNWINEDMIDFDKVAADFVTADLVQKSSTSDFIKAIYQLILNRGASKEEIQAWSDYLKSSDRKTVISLILKSDEFMGSFSEALKRKREEKDALQIQSVNDNVDAIDYDASHIVSDRDFIIKTYDILLKRTPNEADIAHWSQLIEQEDRTFMISNILCSLEYLDSDINIADELKDSAVDLNDVLYKANSSWQVEYYNDSKASAPKRFIQKIIRKLMKFLMLPIMEQQKAFNANVVNCLNEICRKQSLFENVQNSVTSAVITELIEDNQKAKKGIIEMNDKMSDLKNSVKDNSTKITDANSKISDIGAEVSNINTKINDGIEQCTKSLELLQNNMESNNAEMKVALAHLHEGVADSVQPMLESVQNSVVKSMKDSVKASADLTQPMLESVQNSVVKSMKDSVKASADLTQLMLESVQNSVVESVRTSLSQVSAENRDHILEVEGSRHNQLIHYFMEILDGKKENASDVDAAKKVIKDKWEHIDALDSEYNDTSHTITCPVCGKEFLTGEADRLLSECIFNGGKLIRYRCPDCGVIFGPEKMLDLTEEQFSEDYELHYSVYSEGDSTKQEIELFYKLNPNRNEIYLDWGVGAWSSVISKLRAKGYQVYGYDPYAPTDSEYIIRSEEQLKSMKFDAIFSHDLLEHLRDPLGTFHLFSEVLKPGGKMIHSTACFDYVYEYTRFHLFFYTGHSVEKLCAQTDFKIESVERDSVNLLISYTFLKS